MSSAKPDSLGLILEATVVRNVDTIPLSPSCAASHEQTQSTRYPLVGQIARFPKGL